MNAALACPGPSLLATFPGRDGFDLVACVNRAATVIRPDIFAALDLPLILTVSPGVSACELLTCRNTLESLQRRHHPRAAGKVTTTESLSCPVPRWSGYSATAALVLLAERGATEIRVYGADWTPEPGNEGRSAERFEREREIWDGVVEWMKGRGVSVERITKG